MKLAMSGEATRGAGGSQAPSGVRNGVTAGFPFYNEERFIEATIRSAAPQVEAGWASDNASTDRSAAVVESTIATYPHITLVRHPKNLGADFNFRFVLEKATTPYFLWLSGHDQIPEGYVERLVALLEASPDAVLAYGDSQHVDVSGQPTYKYEYDFWRLLAHPSAEVRVLGWIRYQHDGSLIHGIWRTEALRAAMDEHGPLDYLGCDNVLLTMALLKGRFVHDPNTHLILRDREVYSMEAQMKRLMGARTTGAEPLSRLQMGRRQFALAVALSKDSGVAGLLFRLRSHYHLVSRCGLFGETMLTRNFERALFRQHRLHTRAQRWQERVAGFLRRADRSRPGA
jgi:glycosyltransferase involved in cell wall biosynthesis